MFYQTCSLFDNNNNNRYFPYPSYPYPCNNAYSPYYENYGRYSPYYGRYSSCNNQYSSDSLIAQTGKNGVQSVSNQWRGFPFTQPNAFFGRNSCVQYKSRKQDDCCFTGNNSSERVRDCDREISTLENQNFLINNAQSKINFCETEDKLYINLSNIDNKDKTTISIDYK